MHKTVSIGLTMRSLPQNLWKNVGIPKMKIVPSLWAYLVINRIPAPIPGSLVSRLEAGLLTEVFSCRLPERQGLSGIHTRFPIESAGDTTNRLQKYGKNPMGNIYYWEVRKISSICLLFPQKTVILKRFLKAPYYYINASHFW